MDALVLRLWVLVRVVAVRHFLIVLDLALHALFWCAVDEIWFRLHRAKGNLLGPRI